MTPTDDLFQLIKSLLPPEKRYFRLWATRHIVGTQNKYEQLFDAYEALPAQAPYNEAVFKESLPPALVRHFADEKKHLTEVIMQAMRAYRAQDAIDHQLSDLLLDEDFFRQKRLNRLRKKTIDKAKKLATDHERLPTLLTLLEREVIMQIEWQPENLRELSAQLDQQEQQIMLQLQTLATLRYHSHKLFLHLRISTSQATGSLRTESEQILRQPLVKDYQPGLSFGTDYHYYRIHALHHRIHRHMAEHLHYTQLIFELYDVKYPLIRQSRPGSYKLALYNYLNACFTAGRLEVFPALLQKAKAIAPNTKDEEGEDWQNLTHLQLIYYANTARLAQAMDMKNEILEGVKKYSHKVNKARELTLYFNLAAAFFISRQWPPAIDLYNTILQDKTDARQDIKESADLLLLAIYIEQKDFDFATYQLRNTERRMAAAGLKGKYAALFKHLRAIIKDPTLSTDPTPLLAGLSEQAELCCWLQARASKTTPEAELRKVLGLAAR